MFSYLRHWSQNLLTHLPTALPSSCSLCGDTSNTTLCSPCRTQFFGRKPTRCRQCATPLAVAVDLCGDCLKQPPAFDATIVATDYDAPIDQLVLRLKFGNQLALAPLFAQLLRDALLNESINGYALPTQLTAVPLGAQRLSERGFNQALEIAKPLACLLGIELAPHLALRTRNTYAQSMLPPDQRRNNMRHAFVVAHDAVDRIRDRHIGIVDDVITTGATLNELAATFKRYGATRITNFVFARTLHR